MKAYRFLFVFLCSFVLFAFIGCAVVDSTYPNGGRDTHEQFGDRRFVVLRGTNPDTGENSYCLYDQKYDKPVEINLINYKVISPYVYAVGNVGSEPETVYDDFDDDYAILFNYETGYVFQQTDLEAFIDEDQKVFNQLKAE